MSLKCLCEEPDRTLTVWKQKENDISARAAVHSKTACPEKKYRRELTENHKQAPSRLVPSSLQVQNPIEGQSSRGRFLLGVPCFRNWSNIKPLRMKHHLRDVLSLASLTGLVWRKSRNFAAAQCSDVHEHGGFHALEEKIKRKMMEEVELKEICRPE